MVPALYPSLPFDNNVTLMPGFFIPSTVTSPLIDILTSLYS